MRVSENKRFVRVQKYKDLDIDDILSKVPTEHLSNERLERFEFSKKLNRVYAKDKSFTQAKINRVFLVDKGHEAGAELHCITEKGIIFILNERKFINETACFITSLIGRPNQVARLYEDCGEKAPEYILDFCRRNQNKGYNY